MLKRTLMKAGFIGRGLFFMASPIATNLHGQPLVTPQFADIKQISQTVPSTADIVTYGTVVFDSLQAKKIAANEEEPKIKLNPKAVVFVNHYLKTENESLVKIKQRSSRCFKIIENVFKENDLPLELKYLAVIESELKSNAVSRVGAKGPWQLMPSTARLLGLKVTKYSDERTHYYKSTVAVAKYLKDLYAEFGDWLLVIAAYNGGPGTVYKAIKKSGSRNFWYLQNCLPMETRAHVKRFIGAHYFFEQTGSETTLTKTEMTAHRKAMADYKETQLRNVVDETDDSLKETSNKEEQPVTSKVSFVAERNK